jgi:hypothetical protein
LSRFSGLRPFEQLLGRSFHGTDLPDLAGLGPVDDTDRRVREPNHGRIFIGKIATARPCLTSYPGQTDASKRKTIPTNAMFQTIERSKGTPAT